MLSIIIPVFNAEKTIRASLQSCLNQTYQDLELIVIDGGSTDGTLEILQGFRSHLAHFASEKDKGIYDAWNKGLAVARGDWIAFFGADDQWATNDAVEQLMRIAHYPSVNFVSAKLEKLEHQGVKSKVIGEPWSASRMKLHMTTAHVGMPHHRSLFDEFGIFDINYRIAGDYDFLLRALPKVRAGFVENVVAKMGGGGVSSTQLRRARDESFRALRNNHSAGRLYAWLFKLRFNLRHSLRLLTSREI